MPLLQRIKTTTNLFGLKFAISSCLRLHTTDWNNLIQIICFDFQCRDLRIRFYSCYNSEVRRSQSHHHTSSWCNEIPLKPLHLFRWFWCNEIYTNDTNHGWNLNETINIFQKSAAQNTELWALIVVCRKLQLIDWFRQYNISTSNLIILLILTGRFSIVYVNTAHDNRLIKFRILRLKINYIALKLYIT